MAVLPAGLSVWRIALSALAVVYGFACVGSGLDRLSENNPAIEKFVPHPFRAQAETGRASLLIANGKTAMLRDAARDAVLAGPIERRPAALLGMGALIAGDYPAASAAFKVGARLGWREPLTQSYWYQAALETGDFSRAAERLDALLRTQPWQTKADKMLEPLLAAPQGRQALAARLAYRPDWLRRFLVPTENTPRGLLINQSEILLLMAHTRNPLSCEDIRPLTSVLSKSGMPERAGALWDVYCKAGQLANGVWAPGFNELRNARGGSAFGWRLHRSGDLSVTLVDGPQGDAAVAMRNYGTVTRPALSQMVDLAPGTYRVIVKAEPDQIATKGQLAPSLACGNRPERPTSGPINSGQSDIIRAGSCKSAIFALWLQPSPETIVISSVQLQKID